MTQQPRIVGCVDLGHTCTCRTEQGTSAFLDPDQCRDWIANPPYDPFAQLPEGNVGTGRYTVVVRSSP